MSAVKFTLRAALVAASFAVLAVLPAANAQFEAIATDCKEDRIRIVQAPTGDDLTISVSVEEDNDVAIAACALAAAREACKSLNFASAVGITRDGATATGTCQRAVSGADRFAAIATDCNEDDIRVIREPSSTNDADKSISVSVQERDQATTSACARSAVDISCKAIGFNAANALAENGNVVEAQCA